MKKTLFLMFALLCTVVQGWSADKVTDLSQLNDDEVYTIRSERAFLLYSDTPTEKLATSTGSSVGSVTYSLTDPKLQFKIVKNGSNYYLFSVGANKYVGNGGTYETTPSTVFTITNSGNSDYP